MQNIAATRERLMRVQEVAEALRQHPATIYRHVAAGELASVRLGSSPKAPIRIPWSALEEWLGREVER